MWITQCSPLAFLLRASSLDVCVIHMLYARLATVASSGGAAVRAGAISESIRRSEAGARCYSRWIRRTCVMGYLEDVGRDAAVEHRRFELVQ